MNCNSSWTDAVTLCTFMTRYFLLEGQKYTESRYMSIPPWFISLGVGFQTLEFLVLESVYCWITYFMTNWICDINFVLAQVKVNVRLVGIKVEEWKHKHVEVKLRYRWSICQLDNLFILCPWLYKDVTPQLVVKLRHQLTMSRGVFPDSYALLLRH